MTQSRTVVADDEAIISFITHWQKSAWGYAPSFRDVSTATLVPLGTVYRRCKSLREQEKLFFLDHVARSLRVPV